MRLTQMESYGFSKDDDLLECVDAASSVGVSPSKIFEAQILSAAMMLRYSFNLSSEAAAFKASVEKVLDGKDIGDLEIRS